MGRLPNTQYKSQFLRSVGIISKLNQPQGQTNNDYTRDIHLVRL